MTSRGSPDSTIERDMVARFFANQMVVDGGERKQAGNRRIVVIHAAVGKNQQRVAGLHRQRCALGKARRARAPAPARHRRRETAPAEWWPAGRRSRNAAQLFQIASW